jgi:hypothetical protein
VHSHIKFKLNFHVVIAKQVYHGSLRQNNSMTATAPTNTASTTPRKQLHWNQCNIIIHCNIVPMCSSLERRTRKQSQKFAKDLKLSLLEANNKSGTQIE